MFKDTENGHTNFCLNCELLQRKFDDYKHTKKFEIARYEQCLDEIFEICDIQLCKGKIKDLFMYCAMEDIVQKIKEVKEQ